MNRRATSTFFLVYLSLYLFFCPEDIGGQDMIPRRYDFSADLILTASLLFSRCIILVIFLCFMHYTDIHALLSMFSRPSMAAKGSVGGALDTIHSKYSGFEGWAV